MKKWFSRNRWKMKVEGTFSRSISRFASLFKEPRKLWLVFSLRLSLVLCLVSIIPIILLYLLTQTEFIEADIRIDTSDMGLDMDTPQENLEIPTPDPASIPGSFPSNDKSEIPEIRVPGPLWGEITSIDFDPEQGLWKLTYNLSDVAFILPIFKYSVEMEAWLAIGALPLVSLAVGIFLSIWMSRSVTRPFSQLAQAAHAIGGHDLGYRVQTGGSQELQDLAQSFNRMAEQLEHAETNRRNLMADVAHELRTPLAVLDGNLRAMLDGIHALNEEEIALLYEQTHHLNRLVNDLRELSLAEADQLSLDCQEVDIARLVRETVAHFDLIAQEQGIQLTKDFDDPLIHPCLDENRIRQVLHNLLSNAFRYTPAGGKVTISAKRSSENNAVEICVTDTGAGISLQELSHIFDRFYRTEETASHDRGGTGLGLAIAKVIIELHGGRISAQSLGKGLGSTFTIQLPVD